VTHRHREPSADVSNDTKAKGYQHQAVHPQEDDDDTGVDYNDEGRVLEQGHALCSRFLLFT